MSSLKIIAEKTKIFISKVHSEAGRFKEIILWSVQFWMFKIDEYQKQGEMFFV